MPHLILASQSPRRRELLATAGFQFSVRSRPVEEVRAPGESPVEYVRRLARAKAEAAREFSANGGPSDEIVLGADTVVVLGDRVLEKPVDADDAREMLRALSGREHVVITGICMLSRSISPDGAVVDREIVDHEITRVHFVELTESESDAYVSSGEPMDKAGAYAIQGLASKFVDRIEGCHFNVMGLPLARVYRHWKAIAP
jgi:septum formation protein